MEHYVNQHIQGEFGAIHQHSHKLWDNLFLRIRDQSLGDYPVEHIEGMVTADFSHSFYVLLLPFR
jgi:hypothetical protein